MTLIKDPLSPENAEKLEEAAKDISKAALVHHTATQQDELKLIIEERDRILISIHTDDFKDLKETEVLN